MLAAPATLLAFALTGGKEKIKMAQETSPMNQLVAFGFMDELEKLSVDTLDLLKRTRRAAGVRMGESIQALRGGGGMAFPNVAAGRKFIDTQDAPIKKLQSYAQSVKTYLPAKLGRKLDSAHHTANKFMEGRRLGTELQAGNVFVAPGIADRNFSRVARTEGSKRSAERGAIGGLVGSHELSERAVKAKDVNPLFSHIAPEVLMKEHNTLSRLTGPGADYARKTMRTARENTGEAKTMKNLVTRSYGERGAQFLQEGEKIPKAMRKDLNRKLKANPDLLKKSLSGPPLKAKFQNVVNFPSDFKKGLEDAKNARPTFDFDSSGSKKGLKNFDSFGSGKRTK